MGQEFTLPLQDRPADRPSDRLLRMRLSLVKDVEPPITETSRAFETAVDEYQAGTGTAQRIKETWASAIYLLIRAEDVHRDFGLTSQQVTGLVAQQRDQFVRSVAEALDVMDKAVDKLAETPAPSLADLLEVAKQKLEMLSRYYVEASQEAHTHVATHAPHVLH